MLCEKLKEQIAQLQELEELTEEQKALLEQLKNQYSQNCLNDTSYEDDDEDDDEDTLF
jgi:predicted aldo/keto reductase-like oxidoreductase